jgi:hypothetical protein
LDFSYVDSDGFSSDPTIACVRPELASDFSVQTGAFRQGGVAIPVTGHHGGVVEYSNGTDVVASWKMP